MSDLRQASTGIEGEITDFLVELTMDELYKKSL